jgi:hypothetical protein
MKLTPRHSPDAHITSLQNGWRLEIPAGQTSAYRLAQLDDYGLLPRRRFPARPPVTMSLRARASGDSLPGTWGFGLWNDPFGVSLGFGGNPFRLPALPNAVWFFQASEENWLSFSEKPGNGFLAQSFRSSIFDIRLLLAGLTFPFSRKPARQWLGRVIREDGVRVQADPAGWHRYRIEWSATRCVCEVDDVRVLETSVSPQGPLGVVVWIDNQFAAFRPDGKIAAGTLAGPAAWIEISDLEITTANIA